MFGTAKQDVFNGSQQEGDLDDESTFSPDEVFPNQEILDSPPLTACPAGAEKNAKSVLDQQKRLASILSKVSYVI